MLLLLLLLLSLSVGGAHASDMFYGLNECLRINVRFFHVYTFFSRFLVGASTPSLY